MTVRIDPIAEFQASHYVRHNQRRLEHLAILGLPLAGRSAIAVGAGIGDHTEFFLDWGCSVISSDGTPDYAEVLRRRFSWIDVRQLDLEDPDPAFCETADIVYCYGTLYHLHRPARALAFLAGCCDSLLADSLGSGLPADTALGLPPSGRASRTSTLTNSQPFIPSSRSTGA